MKIILGINSNHADSSACILINGKLIAAIEEERINRKKHYSGFPIMAIKECLKISKKKDFEITDIALNTKPSSNLLPKSLFYLKNSLFKKNQFLKRFKKKINLKKILYTNFNLNKKVKFHFIEHHIAHIASAFYPSYFSETIALSIDGSGDFTTFTIANCKNQKINILKKTYFPDSLGIFYHAMTQFLGFKNYGDEYKVMGLAAYGSPKYFDKLIKNLFIKDKKELFKLNLKYFNHHNNNFKYIADNNLVIDQIYNQNFLDLFADELQTDKDQFQKNFASSVQKVYEYFFKKILIKINELNISKKLVFAGGCALNSSANKLISSNNQFFEKIFIPYAPGDNGGALGAAFVVANKLNLKLENLKNPYLGSEFSNDEIKHILDNDNFKYKIKYEYFHKDFEFFKKAANSISEGKVVGWFQGKMEFGPRALGNRSILADPRNPKMKDIINSKIKRRESFRPFAPSVLSEYQHEWFDGNFDNLYMSSLANVIENKKKLIPAVTHFDGTARIQSVHYNINNRYANLLKSFYDITKVPILLNTSFNENEPIVMRPEEALNCLLRTNMDILFIGNFLVEKK